MAIFRPHNTIFSDIFHGNTASNRSQSVGSFNVYFSSNQRTARVSILPQLSHIKWKIWSVDVGGRGWLQAGRRAAGCGRRAWESRRVQDAPARRNKRSEQVYSFSFRYGRIITGNSGA